MTKTKNLKINDNISVSSIDGILENIKSTVLAETDSSNNNFARNDPEFLLSDPENNIQTNSNGINAPMPFEFATLKSLIQLIVREELDKRNL